MKSIFNIFVGLTLILGLSSCGDKPKNGTYRTDTYASGTVSFECDESFSPIINEQIDVFQNIYPAATLNPNYTNELDAMNKLMKGEAYLAITTRSLRESEIKSLEDRDFKPLQFKLAYDGLALIVNNENTDSCLSIQDIKSILLGEKTLWKEINPENKFDSIEVVFDNKQSSTVHFCVDSLLDGTPINSPNIYAVEKSAEVIDFVEKHPHAIGIIGSNWLNDKRDTTNVTFKRNIRVVGVSRKHPATLESSWKPYQYYLYNGNYPLVRTIYAIVNDPIRGLPFGFAVYMHNDHRGQLVFFKAGLLPYRNMTSRHVIVNSDY